VQHQVQMHAWFGRSSNMYRFECKSQTHSTTLIIGDGWQEKQVNRVLTIYAHAQ